MAFKFATLAVSAFAITALATGCSSAKKELDQAASTPSAEATTAAREVAASHVTEVNFEKNSFVLTEGSRAALADLVNQAKAVGTIDDVKVIAYADQAYPADSKKKLSKKERDLATRRANAISSYLKGQLAINDVDTYNMAERPNAMESAFNTSDARIKSALENAGVTAADGKSFTGKSSRAVVMVMLK